MMPETYCQIHREWVLPGGPDTYCPIEQETDTLYVGLVTIGFVPDGSQIIADYYEATDTLTYRESQSKRDKIE